MYNAFRECGWAAWLCLLIGFVGIGVGIAGLVLLATKARKAATVAGVVALALGFLAMGAGLLGRQSGLAVMEAAISGTSVDPSQKERIRALGTAEAAQCVNVGAATGALPFLMGAVAVGLGLALRKPSVG
jgi:hypothetical protein